MEETFVQFVEVYYSKIDSLSREANKKYFDSSISGSDDDYKKIGRATA